MEWMLQKNRSKEEQPKAKSKRRKYDESVLKTKIPIIHSKRERAKFKWAHKNEMSSN